MHTGLHGKKDASRVWGHPGCVNNDIDGGEGGREGGREGGWMEQGVNKQRRPKHEEIILFIVLKVHGSVTH
jgi:hypothetical protein